MKITFLIVLYTSKELKIAFEDCNSFMSSEGQKRHIERVYTRWISFTVLAGLSAFLVALSAENGLGYFSNSWCFLC